MEKGELVFVPWPMMGHLGQLVEFTKLLLSRSGTNLSIKILITMLPESIDPVTNTLVDSLIASCTAPDLNFVVLPATDPAPEWTSLSRGYLIQKQLESQKCHVKKLIRQWQKGGSRLLGMVLDMCSTLMIELAEDVGLPSYIFFTSGAAFLGLMLDFQELQDEKGTDVCNLKFSETDLNFSSFANPIPTSVLPSLITDRQLWSKRYLLCARDYRRAKGIVVNTFSEFESHAMDYLHLLRNVPPVYSVGPILSRIQNTTREVQLSIMEWLDKQPSESVVYISFGSLGGLEMEQARELAKGLERSGCRFLWVLRRPVPRNTPVGFPSEYDDLSEILPEGFLERSHGVGKVVGWAPQLEVLSHGAVCGFVSHCGWNSTLESIWCGVPLATWPVNAEQQLNAFQMVTELGLSVEITLDFSCKKENQALITAEVIEHGLRKVMKKESGVRKRVGEMSKRSKKSMREGGSSYQALERLIHSMFE